MVADTRRKFSPLTLSFADLKLRQVILLLLSTLVFSNANADVLFEGFSKVMLGDVHVGYTIQRYEFDPKKKEFVAVYFLKTGPQGGNLSESVKARSTSGFRPVSYEYTSARGDQTTTIDATFKGETMTAQVTENGKKGVINKKIPKEAFLASFLGYVMLQGKEGIKKGVKYSYKAVAEEDTDVHDGDAYVSAEETMSGVSTFKVLNNYKNSKFVSWVTHKGEVIATASPLQKISTELVATFQEASAGHPVNSNLISMIFGSMPKGKENVIARRSGDPVSPTKQKTLEQLPESTGSSPKTEGIPGGKGIMIKGAKPPPPVESKSDPSSN